MPRRTLARLATAAAVAAALLLTAATAGARGRGLERVLGEKYAPEAAAAVTSAFRAAVSAGLPERDATALVQACVEGEFPADRIVRALALAAQLTLEGLPAEGFAAKIEEGVAKRVDPDRVLAAAERRALAMNEANRILKGLVLEGLLEDDPGDLVADVAQAVEASGAAEVRERLAEALRDGARWSEIRRRLFR